MAKVKKLLAVLVCMAMVAVVAPGLNAWAANIPDGLEYEVYDGYVVITDYNGDATALDIPNKIGGLPVTGIDWRAFYGCSGLTSVTIPGSVTVIGGSAFYGCSGLTSVNIPDGVIGIGDSAFYDCTGLTSVNIPSSVTGIGEEAFYGCSGLTSVSIPDSVASIGEKAFSYCTGLTSVTIPGSVTSIGGWTFWSCTGLKSVTILDGVTGIGENAFWDCTDLTSVTIPSSVTSIGGDAFNYCTSLTSVSIPEGVTSIGDGAFLGCGLTSVTIPSSVTAIGDSAFFECTELTEIKVDGNNAYYASRDGVLFDKDVTELIQYPIGNPRTAYIIPEGVSIIPDYAFEYCTGLKSVTIPDSVTSIGWGAFDGCTGLKDVYYMGNEEDWQLIEIGGFNQELEFANIHYNGTEPEPSTDPEIKAPKVKRDEATGVLNVTVETVNVPKTARLVAISYGTDGGLVGIAPVENGKASLDGENVKSVKVFAWESLESMRPLCEAKEVTV